MILHLSALLLAGAFSFAQTAQTCGEGERMEYAMGMCVRMPTAEVQPLMIMTQANFFAVGIAESGKRGRSNFAAPNFLMLTGQKSLLPHHMFRADLMLTAERWTFPTQGYPELLQIGESDANHRPYIDAQHPHSSPLMGLTLSDTFSVGNAAAIKVFFAPRGASSDGPVPFMHRVTGMVNPDAPLGHHIGQDVGHISSTVVGATLLTSSMIWEFSAFNGREPEPTHVDLPMAMPNSWAMRGIFELSPHTTIFASVATTAKPEPLEPEVDRRWRYSASMINSWKLSPACEFHNTFIYGRIDNLDEIHSLHSFNEEFLFRWQHFQTWGRIEVLQRTARELQVLTAAELDRPLWVTALTLGSSLPLARNDDWSLNLGASFSADLLPSDFRYAYGNLPTTARVFVQATGMGMY